MPSGSGSCRHNKVPGRDRCHRDVKPHLTLKPSDREMYFPDKSWSRIGKWREMTAWLLVGEHSINGDPLVLLS